MCFDKCPAITTARKYFDMANNWSEMPQVHNRVSWDLGHRKNSQASDREVTVSKGSADIEFTLLEMIMMILGAAAVLYAAVKLIHGCWKLQYRRELKRKGRQIVKIAPPEEEIPEE